MEKQTNGLTSKTKCKKGLFTLLRWKKISRDIKKISRMSKGKTGLKIEIIIYICFDMKFMSVISEKQFVTLECELQSAASNHQWMEKLLECSLHQCGILN